MYTLIEVVAYLARRWKRAKEKLDAKTSYTQLKSSNLENQTWKGIDAETQRKLEEEQEGRFQELEQEEDSFNETWGRWFPTSVTWCSQHTGVGREIVQNIAVAGFDASAFRPEQQEYRDLPVLVSKMNQLPFEMWKWPSPDLCTTLNERIWGKGIAVLLERRSWLRRSRSQLRSGSSTASGELRRGLVV